MKKHIYTIWPCDRDGVPGGDWRQTTRWLVLDVTEGIDSYEVVAGPMSRESALAYEMALRAAQHTKENAS